jgi:hypothetical protein
MGSGSVVPRIIDLVSRGKWVVSFTPGQLNPRVPIGQEVGWAPEPVWRTWRGEKYSPYWESISAPSAIHPAASRYTDYVIPATKMEENGKINLKSNLWRENCITPIYKFCWHVTFLLYRISMPYLYEVHEFNACERGHVVPSVCLLACWIPSVDHALIIWNLHKRCSNWDRSGLYQVVEELCTFQGWQVGRKLRLVSSP